MRTLAALLIALPLAAAAQATPPPAPAAPEPAAAAPAPQPAAPAVAASQPPPAATPAPAVAAPQPPPTRGSWYIGFGLGGGSGQAIDTAGSLKLEDWVDASPATLLAQFQAGVTLTPRLLFGGELSVLRIASNTGGVTKAVQITNLDAMLTWYPLERGPFLRGGAGLSSFRRDWTGYDTGQFGGANLTIGAGYAFWLGRTFNLSLHLDYSKQWYGANAIALTNSSYAALWLGFDWY